MSKKLKYKVITNKILLHQEFLILYKYKKSVSKRFILKLALCVKNNEIQASIHNLLRSTSFNIMSRVAG